MKTKPYDISARMITTEDMAFYLEVIVQDESERDAEFLRKAMSDVAKCLRKHTASAPDEAQNKCAPVGDQGDDLTVAYMCGYQKGKEDALASAPVAGEAKLPWHLPVQHWTCEEKARLDAAPQASPAADERDARPTIKGAWIDGGYVIVTPAGWDKDRAAKVRDEILRFFHVNPAYTPRPDAAIDAQKGEGGQS